MKNRYQVFLADDNQLARQALKESVAWEEYNCEIAGEADNGKDVLREVLRLEPDIVLLDIRMPGMSGLEVMSELKERDYSGICIIISAYDDFTYARTGLKLGVFDYILKPVDNGEVQKVIYRACQVLRDRNKQSDELETLKKNTDAYYNRLKQSRLDVERKLLYDGINGLSASAKELEELLKGEGRFHSHSLLLICQDRILGDEGSGDIEYFVDLERGVLQECEACLGVRILDVWKREGMVALLSHRDIRTARDYDIAALKAAGLIRDKSRDKKQEVCITISSASRGLDALPELFEQTVFSYNSRFFLENSSVVHYGSIKSQSVRSEYPLMKKLRELNIVFRERPEQAPECLDAFLDLLCESEVCDLRYVKNILIQAAIMITCIAGENAAGSQIKGMDTLMKEMDAISDLQQAFRWIRDYAKEAASLYQSSRDKGLSAQARMALEYINLHYAGHITLQDAADYAGISASHLCRLLKNDTGETFVSLLNKVRIQAAVRLLKEGRMKVYEIAEAVGYSNYAYFYQLFKKEAGCSPTDYHDTGTEGRIRF